MVVHSAAVPKGVFQYSKAQRNKLILIGLRSGSTNPQIARRMNLAEQTIKGYVSELMEELGASTRTEAVMVAMSRGLITMPSRR